MYHTAQHSTGKHVIQKPPTFVWCKYIERKPYFSLLEECNITSHTSLASAFLFNEFNILRLFTFRPCTTSYIIHLLAPSESSTKKRGQYLKATFQETPGANLRATWTSRRLCNDSHGEKNQPMKRLLINVLTVAYSLEWDSSMIGRFTLKKVQFNSTTLLGSVSTGLPALHCTLLDRSKGSEERK